MNKLNQHNRIPAPASTQTGVLSSTTDGAACSVAPRHESELFLMATTFMRGACRAARPQAIARTGGSPLERARTDIA